MAESSLVPEQQLVFSPGLAATLGLEEAVLLQFLHSLLNYLPVRRRDNRDWVRVERAQLLRQLPFWKNHDLQRICASLAAKGVLLLDPAVGMDSLLYALNETSLDTSQSPSTAKPSPAAARSAASIAALQTRGALQTGGATGSHAHAGLLPSGWAPSEDLLQLLALNHNIPRAFALDQLEDFVFYWRERGETSHAWENKFRQHVLSSWRRQQQNAGETFQTPERPLDNQWHPNADAMEIMLRAGIDRQFIEDAIPEFILYWRERGSAPRELNSRFIQHIRLQWTKYTSSVRHSTEPQRIPEDWQPNNDVLDILRMSHIDPAFAMTLVPEFILFWRDSNQLHTSWNTKFLQHVKYHWARQNQFNNRSAGHDGQQNAGGTGRTRDRSLEQDLRDTSWAE
ncbi:MAG: DnaT-like ssDNA-binding domain-containing protein [Chromatocurvus sp.]